MFAVKRPLWVKNIEGSDCISFKNLKKYEFTKVGKTWGWSTSRYMVLK